MIWQENKEQIVTEGNYNKFNQHDKLKYFLLSTKDVVIAKDWNVAAYGIGYVVEFDVSNHFLSQFNIENVGGEIHNQYWIPAEAIGELNENILGRIRLTKTFKNEQQNISKFLSFVLRHEPEKINIQLDEKGWENVDELIAKMNQHEIKLDFQLLEEVVVTNYLKHCIRRDVLRRTFILPF